MKTRACFILILCGLLFSHSLSAQDDNHSNIYEQARNDYQLGRFNNAIESLKQHLNSFDASLLQRVYRLLSLCYLAQDSLALSENYASLLLKENNSYTSVEDPVRFEEMISRLKMDRGLTIVTASNKEEDINEAPVPVTIITREMIDQMSYNKSLNSILATFVPGFSEVSAAGMDNVAVHGVYTSGQEKILVMENGHRLNARSTNTGKMDYSISLEKIDHIEVLRGPASSLYGNVALTAVVNIITRKGADVNGLKVKYGYGEQSTHKADVLFGNTFYGADVLAWASIYTSKGASLTAQQGTGFSNSKRNGVINVERYDGKPSYDFGTTISLKDFNLMFSRKYGKQVPQYTLYGEVYDFEKYRSLNGVTPGFSLESTHMELGYHRQFGRFNLGLTVNGDWYQFADYTVLSDSIVFTRYNTNGTAAKDSEGNVIKEVQKGLSQKTDWNEFTFGFTIKADLSYNLGRMKGNLLFGMQQEVFYMNSTDYYLGENFDQIELVMPESLNAIDLGREGSMSFFLQDKHYFTDKLIMNAGIRYDRKRRKNDKVIHALSPRVAFVYTPNNEFNVKLSYSRAFVDAPYFYRQNHTNTYSGGENLMPEYMNALQLDFMGMISPIHLIYDVNLFYNQLTDLINNTQKVGESTSAKYRNSGGLKTCGAELELLFNSKWLNVKWSSTYLHYISSEDYYSDGSYILSVPKFMINLHVSKRLFLTGKHSVWLLASAGYQSKTYNKINERRNPAAPIICLDGRFLLDAGLRYRFADHIEASVNVENVFNKTYFVGGTTHFPYQRMGRMSMASVKFHF